MCHPASKQGSLSWWRVESVDDRLRLSHLCTQWYALHPTPIEFFLAITPATIAVIVATCTH